MVNEFGLIISRAMMTGDDGIVINGVNGEKTCGTAARRVGPSVVLHRVTGAALDEQNGKRQSWKRKR